MRRPWATAIQCGSSIEGPPKGHTKKLRKLSRASAAPASHRKNSRRRFKHSWFRAGRQRRSLHAAVEVRALRRGRLAGPNGLAARGGKLRGPYHLRALRARWRVAGENRARLRYTARGSSAAAKNATARSQELIDWAMHQVQQLKQQQGSPVSPASVSMPPAVIETVVDIVSSPSLPIRQGRLPVVEQPRAAPPPPPPKAKRDGDRSLIASTDLEAAITQAVRNEGPGCEAFVGVIVQQTKPKSRFDANWILRGVKYGRADRTKADEALATIVERMQREFKLSGD
jgi:hypothetical protein